jgi:hypothetical protein
VRGNFRDAGPAALGHQQPGKVLQHVARDVEHGNTSDQHEASGCVDRSCGENRPTRGFTSVRSRVPSLDHRRKRPTSYRSICGFAKVISLRKPHLRTTSTYSDDPTGNTTARPVAGTRGKTLTLPAVRRARCFTARAAVTTTLAAVTAAGAAACAAAPAGATVLLAAGSSQAPSAASAAAGAPSCCRTTRALHRQRRPRLPRRVCCWQPSSPDRACSSPATPEDACRVLDRLAYQARSGHAPADRVRNRIAVRYEATVLVAVLNEWL